MAIPINIENLINGSVIESNRIEFKSDYNPSEIISTICAFANDINNMGGGYVVIGVEEENGSPKFPVKGIDKSKVDGILKKLHNHCHFIEPLYEPVAEPVMFEDVYVILVWVSGGHARPYKAPKDVTANQSIKHYFIRKYSSTVIADSQEVKTLFNISCDIPFDDRENLAADVEDLSLPLMREHLKEIGSKLYEDERKDTLALAADMQLLGGTAEYLKPKNVGILMFSQYPEKYFKYARIEVVVIPDVTGNGMEEKTFTGPIQYQLRMALDYIRNYVITEKITKIADRAEADRVFNYPLEAVEEILANAVYHRSYQVNEPITVRVTPEGMEITSHPGFDYSISDKMIAAYDFRARIYRNRRIGDFLKELHLIEGRNTGFPTAIKALEKNGSGRFSVEMDAGRSFLSIWIPIHKSFLPLKSKKEKEYEEKIISLLTSNPMTLTELSKALGYRSISKRLSTTVESLSKSKKIEVELEGRILRYKA